MKRKIAVVDFETFKIDSYPDYPPEPVGVALSYDRVKKYMAWDHPIENNCTKEEAVAELRYVFANYKVQFHNAPFDIMVAMIHLGLKRPVEFDDTLYMAYLHDPRDVSLALKPLADKYLNMPPDEQTELKEWIFENLRLRQDTKEIVFTRDLPRTSKGAIIKKGTVQIPKTHWGAYIAYAPGKLVGKYAIGDIDRTRKLAKFFWPIICEAGMQDAYEREIKLTFITMNMTDVGTRVAVSRLQKDVGAWDREIKTLDKKIRRKLKCSNHVNLNSDQQLADALEHAGLITHWIKTSKGQRSTSRPNLEKTCTDKKLLDMLSRKGVLETYSNTFGHPWLDEAKQSGGYIHPSFNQTRNSNEYGAGGRGTRTGRLSSSNPNLQNVPEITKLNLKKDKWAVGLPSMRDYLIADVGCVLNGRDFSQQELRLLAEFEQGALYHAYLDDPSMDAHNYVGELIHDRTGIAFPRRAIKGVNFGVIYGMGIASLARQIGQDKEDARLLKQAHSKAFPDIDGLNKLLKKAAQQDQPIYTIGGRQYYCEEPTTVFNKETQSVETYTWEYKLLNYLIQGSAADVTKQAMINVHEACNHSRITVQIHDEIIINSDKAYSKSEMKLMKEAMEDMSAFDIKIPMLTDGAVGSIWGRMKKSK